ncbi:MAG: hypothetical protein ACTHJ1_13740 [Bordetella sp.]|uniref:hypothetical protein n=1 Tax=Bordetella sp. TaxID=28081 RepID=UPI003F7B3797
MDTQQLQDAIQILKSVKPLFESPSSQWITASIGIAGAAVGSIATFFPNWLLELCKKKSERTNISNALIAEVNALLKIVSYRRYIEEMEQVVARLNAAPPGTRFKYVVKVQEHYARIYQANIERLGILDTDLAVKIIEFHQMIDAVVQDIRPGGVIADQGGDAEGFRQMLEIAQKAKNIGEEITHARHQA